MPAGVVGQPAQLPAQPPAAVPCPARRLGRPFQSRRARWQPLMSARGLVGAQLAGPGDPRLPGALGFPAARRGAAAGPGRALGRDPAGREQVGGARRGADQRVQCCLGGVQAGPLPLSQLGLLGQRSQLSVDLGDPLLAVRGAGGRADVPGLGGDVTAAQRPVPPASVGGHRGGRARVVETDSGEHRRDRRRGQAGRRIGAQRSGQ